GVDPEPGLALRLRRQVSEHVHAGRVEVTEERLPSFVLPVYEIEGRLQKLLIDGLHALLGQRSSVFDLAVGEGMNDAARAEPLAELGTLRIVGILGLLLRIQVVEVAEELVEAVLGRQKLVLVTQVVLAELTRRIAEWLQHLGDARVLRAQSDVRARQAD